MRFKTTRTFFGPLLRPYWGYFSIMMGVPVATVAFQMLNAYGLKCLIDGASSLSVPLFIFMGAACLQEGTCRLGQWAFTQSQPLIRAQILSKAYAVVQTQPWTYFQNTASGSIASKIKGIVSGYDDLLDYIWYKITTPLIMVVLGAGSLFWIHKWLAWVVLLGSVIFFGVSLLLSFRLRQLSAQASKRKHQAIGLIADNISNIATVFMFGTQQQEAQRLDTFACREVAPLDTIKNRYALVLTTTGSVLFCTMIGAVLGVLAFLKTNHVLSKGDLAYTLTVVYKLTSDLWTLTEKSSRLFDKLGDFKASMAVLDTPPPYDVPDAQALTVSSQSEAIAFEQVSFKYADMQTEALHNINLVIPKGQKVGIVGHSGAGKSTLLHLLLKQFPISTGDIRVFGQSINTLQTTSLVQHMAIVPQDSQLFHRSIAANIGYARSEASLIEIEAAAKQAQLHDFILTLPQGYNTLVGEKGVKLSGGQRQRVAIARALLKNAPILILDEATSHCDSHTEAAIQASLRPLLHNQTMTILAIAHRLSTIAIMDRILVLDQGKLCEDGPPHVLLANPNSLFKALWDHQSEGFI